MIDRSDDELKNVIGLGLSEAISHLYPHFNDQQINQFCELYRTNFLSPTHLPAQLFAGIEKMIKKLHDSGVMIAIATGKSRQGLELAIDESGIRSFIHTSRCADETFSKPNPQMLEEILDEFSLTVEQAIMIGDTTYDLEMARHIKMDCLGVSYGVHEENRLIVYKPLMVCSSVEQLGKVLLEKTIAY